ncbi:MAG TPA: ABC transporter ATP-binding protein [Clostridiales bacterium]|jgi:ABC-2 type transport system ATP-binding protein|nr:ABC transporter ATP-binding protein [Clostridiales bacterium]HOL92626.1 ABC transporter ATP-binding protein [Clostridiales bacterium]
MDTVVEMKNVTKDFKNFRLDNVSLTLEKGYVMGLVGANGAGKTTIIKLIMNLLRKDSGSINVFGMDNQKFEKEIKQRIGFVYDENIYPEHLRLEKIGAVISSFYTNWNQERFIKYLKMFELDPKIRLSKLSKGMKMKFAIAVALSHDAELIIMDEPTSGLDPVFRREVLDLLHGIMEDGECSIIFSSHITSDLDKIADVITLVDKGRIVLSMPYDEMMRKYRVLKGPKSLIDRIDPSWLQGVRVNRFGFDALCLEGERAAREFGNTVVLEKPGIEDIMVYYTRKAGECSD